MFFVWRSGILETVTGNIAELVKEELLQRLLTKLVKYTLGKVTQSSDDCAAGALPVAEEMAIHRELRRRERDEEPYDRVEVPPDTTPLTDEERAQLETEVAEDPQIQDELAAILAGHREASGAGTRGGYVAAPKPTRMSPDVLDELVARDEGERGIAGAVVLAAKTGRALVRVVQRLRSGRGHGVYPTVLEELMREFYLADVGGILWHAMKKDTLDTFARADPPRGGWYLLDRLATELRAASGAVRPLPKITLVGHSTGAVFIDHLIGAVEHRRADFPDRFRFSNVAFLAPACTHDHFATALRCQDLIGRFRLFTMTDEAERTDRLVGAFYPRSLLYLIAGVLERDAQDCSTYRTITGLARYLDHSGDADTAISAVCDYLDADPVRVVRSPTSAGAAPGQQAGARTHSGFDEDALVLASLTAMIHGDP